MDCPEKCPHGSKCDINVPHEVHHTECPVNGVVMFRTQPDVREDPWEGFTIP